ncbi:MAG TPA: diacylglycerol kinase [Desulfuromonadales bacterium]|nr:diacylglycerol kinase [Desulfuromonadales bacterium]
MKPTRWMESVNCAIEGILWTVRTQRHMRIHFLAAVAVLLLALAVHLSALEFVLLALAVTLVLFAELFNTAIEALVDLVSPDYHPLAGRVKDVAAGAVLVASIGAAVIGYLAFSRHLPHWLAAQQSVAPLHDTPLAVISVLVVAMVVVMLKALLGRGTPLHGGMPSGHAAVAFSIATAIAFSQGGILVTLLATALAVMVSHSRLVLRIHTLREVVAGAALGMVITLMLFLTFS